MQGAFALWTGRGVCSIARHSIFGRATGENGKIKSSVPPPTERALWKGGELVLTINICAQTLPKVVISEQFSSLQPTANNSICLNGDALMLITLMQGSMYTVKVNFFLCIKDSSCLC